MLIDGRALAQEIKENIKNKVAKLGFRPGLAVVLVGEDPASKIYVRAKERACEEAGFYSKKIVLPTSISQKKLLKEIEKLNNDPKIHGILVQLPMPKHLEEKQAIQLIKPEKDVDCFHPVNVGKLSLIKRIDDLNNFLAPCTPKGVIKLIESVGVWRAKPVISGKKAVIVGRSNLVGKPLALLLLAKNATVTICHSKTKDLKKETKEADILVAAVGKAGMITADMVKKGAIVIDVGISRVGKKIVGDVGLNFYDVNGNFIESDFKDRIVKLGIDKIKKIRNKIAIAFGPEKTEALKGFLKTGIADVVITDSKTAEKLLI